MAGSDPKADLQRYLQEARDAMLWKLEGLSEYDIRRPLVPTGTNLLGLVKHIYNVEFVYFGATFGRPSADKPPWSADEPAADTYAAADESREQITGLYKKAWVHSDVTIEALSLDAPGRVPHWRGERGAVTLHRIMVHVIAESHRHAGHADIVRELVDGAVGLQENRTNLPSASEAWWEDHRRRVEHAAQQAAAHG
jgi:uncharacterized damage-inducible protein DinB